MSDRDPNDSSGEPEPERARPIVCTIATPSHRAYARCLAESFLAHHGDGRVFVLEVGNDGRADYGDARITPIFVEELRLPEYAAMRERYDAFELCNALKPFLLLHLLAETAYERICYLDADTHVFGPMYDAVWGELASCALLLTPHLVDVPPSGDDSLAWRDVAILRNGTYNGGFVGVARGEESERVLRWWASRVVRWGYRRVEEGMNCDQLWLDLVPGFCAGARIGRDRGLNVAFWNLHERKLATADGAHMVDGVPLKLFHFSGYSPDAPDVVTKFRTQFTFDTRPDLRPVFDAYRASLARAFAIERGESPPETVDETSPAPTAGAASIGDAPQTVRPSAPARARATVSVVIPAYNSARFLRPAIESALAQTGVDLEVVVVDDGSIDASRRIAESYPPDLVRCVAQANGGVAAARNRGVRESGGDYVAFLDADDYFLSPTKLEEQARILEDRPDRALVQSGWRMVDASGESIAEKRPWTRVPRFDTETWLAWQPVLPSAMMVRRDAFERIGAFESALAPLEDVDWVARALLGGWGGAWHEHVAVAYRQHGANASWNVDAQARALGKFTEKLFARTDLPLGVERFERQFRYGTTVWIACRYFLAGRFEEMREWLLRSLPYATSKPGATMLRWVEGFETACEEGTGRPLDTFALTERTEWQSLARELVFGDGASGEEEHAEGNSSEGERRSGAADVDFERTPDAAAGDAEPGLAYDETTCYIHVDPEPETRVASPELDEIVEWLRSASSDENPGDAASRERLRGASSRPAPGLDLTRALAGYYGDHRSGWAYALASLGGLHREGGVFVDAFVEQSFARRDATFARADGERKRPWVGFLHNPPNFPERFGAEQSPQRLLASPAFRASLDSCRGLFCLSEYLADWWRSQNLGVAVESLVHPTEIPETAFGPEAFAANPRPRVVQVGTWLRRLRAIHALPVRRLGRAIVHQHLPYVEALFARAQREATEVAPCDVEVLPLLSNAEYDDLLAANVVFLDLYDGSANNTIVECLARCTPVLVNRLPAVVEYLGEDYPFFYEDYAEAASKAEDARLVARAHAHMRENPVRARLSGEAFAREVAASRIYGELP